MYKPTSIADFIQAWDNGIEVQTVNMGGLGEAYDLAIQCVAMEMLRKIVETPGMLDELRALPVGEPVPEEMRESLNLVVKEVDAKQEDGSFKMGGLSGAQVGAAMSFAFHIAYNGYESVYEAGPDRLVGMKKQDPVALLRKEEAAGS